MNPIYFGVFRHLLTIAAGALVTKGYIDQAGAEALVGGLLAVVGVGASIFAKVRAK